MKAKPKFRVGQTVMINRTYTGERFKAILKKCYGPGASGVCWKFTREGHEYEDYMSPLRKISPRPRKGKP